MSDQHAGLSWRATVRAHASGLVLRALVLACPLLALGCTWRAGGRTVPLVDVLVAVLAVTCAWLPDSHAGLVVVLLLGVEWLATVHDPATPWALAAGVALTVFHTALAAATVAPPAAAWTPSMRRRWLRRLLAVLAVTAGTWAAVAAIRSPRPAGNAALVVAALVVLALVALWTRHGTLDTDSGR